MKTTLGQNIGWDKRGAEGQNKRSACLTNSKQRGQLNFSKLRLAQQIIQYKNNKI